MNLTITTLCHNKSARCEDWLIASHFLAELFRIGEVSFQLQPEGCAMAHDFGVCQFVDEYVVDKVPWQLHEENAECDFFIVVAAAPTAFQLSDTDAFVL
jgi:hypothetical protein